MRSPLPLAFDIRVSNLAAGGRIKAHGLPCLAIVMWIEASLSVTSLPAWCPHPWRTTHSNMRMSHLALCCPLRLGIMHSAGIHCCFVSSALGATLFAVDRILD